MSRKSKKSESSNLSSVGELTAQAIATIDSQYLEHLELQNVQLANKLKEAFEVNEELYKKVQHLEGLLSSVQPSTPKFVITPEEMIAEYQINRLLEVSKERQLTLDETRQYDLLVKNKRLAMSEPTTIEGSASKVKDVKDVKELSNIAKLKLEDK